MEEIHIGSQSLHFDELAEKSTDSLYDPNPCLSQNDVNKFILSYLEPGKTILEIGAGKGKYTTLFLKNNFEVTAVDISAKSLEVLYQTAKTYGVGEKLKTVKGTVQENLNLLGRFDYVVFTDTLHHITKEGTDSLFAILGGLLAPAGRIVAYEPNGHYPFWRLMGLINKDFIWEYEKNILHCTKSYFRDAFKKNGLEMVQYVPYRIVPMFLIDRLPALKRLDNFLMKFSIIRHFSSYSIIIARKP